MVALGAVTGVLILNVLFVIRRNPGVVQQKLIVRQLGKNGVRTGKETFIVLIHAQPARKQSFTIALHRNNALSRAASGAVSTVQHSALNVQVKPLGPASHRVIARLQKKNGAVTLKRGFVLTHAMNARLKTLKAAKRVLNAWMRVHSGV